MTHVTDNLTAVHPFVKLRQPIDPSTYPEPREFKPLETYIYPFTFVVPDVLLPHACNHHTSNPHLQTAHMQLPPSLGDPMFSGDGKSMINDMSPMMSEIAYRIKASVIKKGSSGIKPPFNYLLSVAKKLRVIPASIEQPPLEIICNNTDGYRTRNEKHIRKTLLGGGKAGHLVVAAAQPKPLQLPAPGGCGTYGANTPASTHVKLNLRFDPANDSEQPPRLRSIQSKLKVSTFYATVAWRDFPSKEIATSFNNTCHGVYSETLNLSSLCVAAAQWEKHDRSEISINDSRRSSVLSDSSSSAVSNLTSFPSASSSYSGKTFYTASIVVPISLPTNRTFVPTFHSCLTSRVYKLNLSLSYQSSASFMPLSPSVSLGIPIQITSLPGNGNGLVADQLPDMLLPETRIEDEYYLPRSIAPSSEDDYGVVYSPDSPQRTASSDFSQGETGSQMNSEDRQYAPPEYATVTQSRSGVQTSNSLSPAWILRSTR